MQNINNLIIMYNTPSHFQLLAGKMPDGNEGNDGNNTENSTPPPICPPPPMASEDDTEEYWPGWVENVTHISHFLLAFNCSVNFYIYFFKRRASRRQGIKLQRCGALHTLQY